MPKEAILAVSERIFRHFRYCFRASRPDEEYNKYTLEEKSAVAQRFVTSSLSRKATSLAQKERKKERQTSSDGRKSNE